MKKYRFAFMSFVFVALAAYALSPATQWGDVLPTNTLAQVAADAGLATTTSLANAIATEASTRASHVESAYINATNESARSARGKYVPLDGSMRMTGPLQASQYVGFDGGNQQTYYRNQSVLFRFWGRNFYFNFPSDFDTGIGNNTNSYFATRYWTDSFVSNSVATAITNYLGLSNNCVKIGIGADTVDAANAVAVGLNTYAQYNAVAVGSTAKSVAGECVAVGPDTIASEWGAVAIGKGATASSAYAVQIGAGNNTSNNSFKVFNTMLLDADGHVPLLTGQSYDLTNAADVTRALGDIITALGGTVE